MSPIALKKLPGDPMLSNVSDRLGYSFSTKASTNLLVSSLVSPKKASIISFRVKEHDKSSIKPKTVSGLANARAPPPNF